MRSQADKHTVLFPQGRLLCSSNYCWKYSPTYKQGNVIKLWPTTQFDIAYMSQWKLRHEFVIRRHKSIAEVSTVKPTRCTNVSNLFYFGMTLYMFRAVPPSIIRSSRLYIQQQAFVKQILLSAGYIQLPNRYCCMYSLELLMMDGKTVRNM